MVARSQCAALRRARARSAAKKRPAREVRPVGADALLVELSQFSSATRAQRVEVKRPTAEDIAALPAGLQERAFNPYTRAFLGEHHFGVIGSEEVKIALETYRQICFFFDDARLALAVALHQQKRMNRPKKANPMKVDTRDA